MIFSITHEETPVARLRPREICRLAKQRGKPQINTFDAAAWNAGAITLADPIVGTCCTVDTDLPRIRFVMDPLKPVFQGTRRIRESRADE